MGTLQLGSSQLAPHGIWKRSRNQDWLISCMGAMARAWRRRPSRTIGCKLMTKDANLFEIPWPADVRDEMGKRYLSQLATNSNNICWIRNATHSCRVRSTLCGRSVRASAFRPLELQLINNANICKTSCPTAVVAHLPWIGCSCLRAARFGTWFGMASGLQAVNAVVALRWPEGPVPFITVVHRTANLPLSHSM